MERFAYTKREVEDEIMNTSEQDAVTLTSSSAGTFETIAQLVSIPKDVRGKKILDIGGGGSNFTAALIEMGAEAYAVDPKYKDLDMLETHVRDHIVSLYKLQRAGLVGKGVEDETAALKHFLESTKRHPDHYIAASTLRLPFRDNQFDYVYSVRAMTIWIDPHKDWFLKAGQEAIRVLKPEGLFQAYPFFNRAIEVDPSGSFRSIVLDYIRYDNQQALLELLKKTSNVAFDVQEVDEKIGSGKLVVVKNS